jgi:sodium-dependent dicarboxylate transporter 2/3/5
VNPYLTLLPTTIAASFAFMLPVATPPAAIAFSYGKIRIIDMVSGEFHDQGDHDNK